MGNKKLLLLLVLVTTLVLCGICAKASGVNVSGGNVAAGGGAIAGGSGSETSQDLSGTCGTNATWKLSDDGTLTISGTGKIDANAFSYNKVNAVKLVIEEGITEIGNYAFEQCYRLREVILPDSITVLGNQAFIHCSNLSKLTMGGNIKTLPAYAFGYCGFETFTIPDGVTTINNYAITGENLKIVYVPDSVTSISSTAFGYNGVVLVGNKGSYAQQYANNYYYNGITFFSYDDLTMKGDAGANITYSLDIIEGTLTFTGSGSMKNFDYYSTPWWNFGKYISKVTIDKNITTIGNYAFYGCTKLTSFTCGDNITEIGAYAFYECRLLKSVGVLNNVTYIGDYAFKFCSSLRDFPAGDKLKYIGAYAFSNTESISELFIYDSIETLDASAFDSATVGNLNIGKMFGKDKTDAIMVVNVRGTISVDGDNTQLIVADNVLMDSDKTAIIKSGAKTGEYTVPASVKKICEYAFDAKEITGVNFPDGLEEIGKRAFTSCNYLRGVSIPLSVKVIGDQAFNGSYNFTISGYSNSMAEKYANDNGCIFVSLGNATISEIKVKNSYELLYAVKNAVAVNVILADGVYAFEETLSIENAYNLNIKAENQGKAEILTFNGYIPVIKFEKSANVTLNGLILGHYSLVYKGNNCGNGSSSGGYVIYSEHSENITVDYCDLYGCGTYAAYLSYTGSMNIKNSVLRDCSQGIAYITGNDYSIENTDIVVEDCIISGNAYLEQYANNYCAIVKNNSNYMYVNNCTFLNNYSTRLYDNSYIFYEDCQYADNAWDGYTPGEYGVCLNGITWEIVSVTDNYGKIEKVLKIGFDIECNAFVIKSELGAVLPYSTSSLPWKGKEYDRIELNDGITYDDINVHSACGYDMRWTLNKNTGVLIIDGSGKMFEYYHWEYLTDYIKTIYASEDITYIYRNALQYTPFFYETGERIDGLLYIGRHLVDADVQSGTVVVRDGTISIAECTFEYCGMTKVVIPDSVTVLPDRAFAYSEQLEKVELPDTITEIGSYAFQRCFALKELTIPVGVVSIGDGAFENCTSLKEITISANVRDIGNSVFYGCTSLETATLPKDIEEVGENMFWGCTSLKEVKLTSALTKISYGAFRDCTSLKEFVIPDGVTYVDSCVFENCSGMTKLTIPASVKELYNCIQNCTSLKEIVYEGTRLQWDSMLYNFLADNNDYEFKIIGKDFAITPPDIEYRYDSYLGGLEIIGAKSFVTDLVVPDEIDGYPVKSIAYNAFTNNTNIKSVVLPDNLEYVSADAFTGTGFYNDKSNWSKGILYIGNYLLCADKNISGDVNIDAGTKMICEYAFYGCSKITTINMPQSVERIMSGVFSNCTKLKNIVFPDGITELYSELFYNCTSLESITLPKNIIEFSPYVFYGCSAIKNVYIADGNDNYCSIDGVVYDSNKSEIIYYPSGRNGTAVVNSGVTRIASNAFMFSNIEKISIPVSLTYIAEGAFQCSYSLCEVIYAGTEEQWNEMHIGQYGNDAIFDSKIVGNGFVIEAVPIQIYNNGDGTATVVHCAGYVKEITIPATYDGVPVTSIYDWAFENCYMLEKINVDPDNEYFKSVDGVLFTADMKSLVKYPAKKSDVSYTVPETVENMCGSCFAYSNLEEITLSPKVTALENFIFEGCSKLKKVVILEGTQTIGYAFFESCVSLETVAIPESMTWIDDYAFNNCPELKTVLYGGFAADWEKIYIGEYNEYLDNVYVICGKIAPAVEYTEFEGVQYSPVDETAVVSVFVEGVKETFTMLAAVYDSNDKMVAMEKVPVAFAQDGEVVDIKLTSIKMSVIPKLKLFFWDDENLSMPVGKPMVLENVAL